MTGTEDLSYDIDFKPNQLDENNEPLLISAVKENNFELVRKIARGGDKLNVYDKRNVTALMAALELNNFDIFEFLLLFGADINFKVNYSPLMYAVKLNMKVDIIKYIVDNGGNISAKTKDGSSLLHLAAANGNKEIIDYLVSCGLDVNGVNVHIETPLHVAVKKENLVSVEALFKNGASINAQDINGNTPLLISYQLGDQAISEYLVNTCLASASISNIRNETVYSLSFDTNDYKLFRQEHQKALLNYNIRSQYWWTLLKFQLNRYLYNELILRGIITNETRTTKGVKLSDIYCISQHYFNEWMSRETLWKLLYKSALDKEVITHYFPVVPNIVIGRNINQSIIACFFGKKEIVSYLIEQGIDFMYTTEKGNTLLHAAAKRGDEMIVRMLLNTNLFDLEAKNNIFFTPLLTAFYYGKAAATLQLMRYSQKPDMELVEWIKDNTNHECTQRLYDIIVNHYINKEEIDYDEFKKTLRFTRFQITDKRSGRSTQWIDCENTDGFAFLTENPVKLNFFNKMRNMLNETKK